MKILVINAGSSSLKYQLFSMTNNDVLAKGLCERIGMKGTGVLKHKAHDKEQYVVNKTMHNHTDAINLVIDILTSKDQGVIKNLSDIKAVGHRVLHGGEVFSDSVVITDEVMKVLEDLVPLGPLHMPPNIDGIKNCEKVMDNIPQVAVFDTSFHQTMPKHAYMYGLPYEYYEKYKVRRYGFHGTSHKYVTSRVPALLYRDIKDLKVVTCHLGNGSSICAVKGGKCIDTSMGLTPLEGVMMGTRCGSIDPAIVTFLMEKEGIKPKQMDDLMNKKSGVLGISQLSSDFRDLEAAKVEGNELAALALKMFAYQVAKYIGSYAAVMNGLDAVVFTAGIGENNISLRQEIMKNLEFLGAKIDEKLNKEKGKEIDISTPDARVRTLVIPTNEELMIALETQRVVNSL